MTSDDWGLRSPGTESTHAPEVEALSKATLQRFRLLALDIDGTLLDRDGVLRPSTANAVARAAEAGIRPILCTGRRYRRARPIAEMLGLDAPLVCNSGALVKDPANHRTLWKAGLSADMASHALILFASSGEPAVSFTDDDPSHPDFVVERFPTGRPMFDDYVEQNHEHAGIVPGWTGLDHHEGEHFHLCAIGEVSDMLELERIIHRQWPEHFRTFVQRSPRYLGTMCEVLRHDASKWAAILHLAEHWGIEAVEICAVGDDMNDVPMIAGAGLGVAMGHAPAAVLAAADYVTGDHDHDGVAAFIDKVLLA